MKHRTMLSLALVLALILALFAPAAAAEVDPAEGTPRYEIVVPLEYDQIYQESVILVACTQERSKLEAPIKPQCFHMQEMRL